MSRGSLRIYLGAAPGVGKTYAMLNEGVRRLERGTDVVVGIVETHGRPHTEKQLFNLEVIPRVDISYRDQVLQEMDLAAILTRRPGVVLVDEFAHTNAPGSKNEKRWQDVEEILESGINVITTLNVQHLESINDVVERITGVVQRETVPDVMVRRANQIELVDMTPEALRRRLAHGNVYPADRIDAALTHYFRPGNLAALRELALLWLADRVDDELVEYRERFNIDSAWETRERVVVAVAGAADDERTIRRAGRIAARLRAELIGVTVLRDDGLRSGADEHLARSIEILEELGGRYVEIVSTDVAKALVTFARAENATQIVIGSTRRTRTYELLRGSVVQQCVREARGEIDVHVIGSDIVTTQRTVHRAPQRRTLLSRSRVAASILVGLVTFPLITLVLSQHPTTSTLPLAMSAFMLVVIAVASVGGLLPGITAALVAFLISNWEFTPPVHTFSIQHPADVLTLLSFLIAAITVSSLVDFSARRSAAAVRAQRDARALARLTSFVMSDGGDLSEMVTEIMRTFDLIGVSLERKYGDRQEVLATAGTLDEPIRRVELGEGHVLILGGRRLDTEQTALLGAVTTQLVAALERQGLVKEAAERNALKRADELRSALLQAVSHDLRTPLASIKAAATTLLSPNVTIGHEESRELLEGIDDESDRLNSLIEDLLDMSRIQESGIDLVIQEVDLAELVNEAFSDAAVIEHPNARNLTSSGLESCVVMTDSGLVERVIVNLIANALVHGGEEPVVVDIGVVGEMVSIRVIDHGLGVPPDMRDAIFQPFQRLGDVSSGRGVGLGLAIARGFVEALGGELVVEDTPGHGCTMSVLIPLEPPSANS